MGDTNITRAQARGRAELIDVASYEIAVDLSEATTSATFDSRTSVRFGCSRPGASTWIDVIAAEVTAVELNGRALDPRDYDGARIRLPDLAADNALTVAARCHYMRTGEGMHRSTDPADGRTYLYTQFATAEARRVFACFEQPDLKATFAWDVRAPAGWTVLSTTTPEEPRPTHPGGPVRWVFPPTPRLSTYLAVLCAGPFHSVHDQYDGPHGRYPLAVHCRVSMAPHLDAAEILAVTAQGLAYYEQAFGVPLPFGTYDQVFLPEFNLGAMENPGCVTFREDGFIFRSRVTQAARESRANVILHEMAHMWFGDLVTMRWWDDLWLNESFAEWAGSHVNATATRHVEAWTAFAQARKAWAYQQDQLPSTHPIAADMVDLEAVYLNFDGITYAKGASVVKQLVAHVGQEAFLEGLGRYFRRFAWGSTTLADLIAELEGSSGRDLSEWVRLWLELPGVNTLQPAVEVDGAGRYATVVVEQLPPNRPDGMPQVLRPHRVALGLYGWHADDAAPGGRRLRRSHRVEVDVAGARTAVPELAGLPVADLLLVNDDDLTYAKIRLDPASLRTAVAHVGDLADSLPRALVWGSLWESVRDCLLPAQEFVDIALRGLAHEQRPGIVETVLRQAALARTRLTAPSLSDAVAERLCRGTAQLLAEAEPGSDRQLSLASAHVACAVTGANLVRLAGLLAGAVTIEGLPLDQDLRWAIVVRLCARGQAGEELVEAELARDRTTKGMASAARARAAIPTSRAKQAAWDAAVSGPGLTNAVLEATLAGFADPERPELAEPYRRRYVDVVEQLWASRSPAEAATLAEGLFPAVLVERETLDVAEELLARPQLPSGLRRIVVEEADAVRRALECRRASAAAAAAPA